ncbi:uncharacterized protein LAESUDRAFT_727669 [Laetiporus sulphureus 93-53]|uniref:Uncharacterized protein n=1 Tax=Laetiporus sulphureus 93-53 TaxID=1314785 RepID=A0A165DFW1_9APHY|nr:uncharacterized protein LAESUDRAFT_727669 [Laetiporus sulphureus 93-53]KZT04804.1 hypothetical protein LAESUDRAFT_727669 [Laetiporus sulphureus 93-53]
MRATTIPITPPYSSPPPALMLAFALALVPAAEEELCSADDAAKEALPADDKATEALLTESSTSEEEGAGVEDTLSVADDDAVAALDGIELVSVTEKDGILTLTAAQS